VAALVLFFVPVDHVAHGGPTGQYFISTPTNITVNNGHHARLSCTIGNLVGTCQWTRDGLALGTDRNLAGFSRYLMAGDREDICDLSIDPVLPLDEGVYQCQVSGGHGVAPITSAPVTLSVNREPGQPYIVQANEEDMMEVQEGEEVELECQSQGGRPPAEIQWWDGEGRRIVSDVTEHVVRMEDRKTFKTVSTLKFTPDQPISVKCSVSNDAFPAIKKSETLQIKFKGQEKLEIKKVSEGESFLIECKTDESRDIDYKWFINDKELFSENSKTLKIEHFVPAYDNSVIKCAGQDREGGLQVWKSVKLRMDSSHKEDVELKEALALPSAAVKKKATKERKSSNKKDKVKKTIFTCIAEEDTPEEPTYVWMKGKLGKKVVAEDEKKRKFKCKVVPSGYNKLNQMVHNMKDISRMFKKFSRSFIQVVTAMDGT